jgi:hypothetical protein
MTNQFQRGNNRAAKLTGEQVVEMRERYKTERGLSQSMLAREYDCSINTIARILSGQTWRHLLRGEEPQVYRPPINARPPIINDERIEASKQLLQEKLRSSQTVVQFSGAKKAPSLYNDPPPTLAEDEAAGQAGVARLNRELDGPEPLKQQQVSDELGKLEKGD